MGPTSSRQGRIGLLGRLSGPLQAFSVFCSSEPRCSSKPRCPSNPSCSSGPHLALKRTWR